MREVDQEVKLSERPKAASERTGPGPGRGEGGAAFGKRPGRSPAGLDRFPAASDRSPAGSDRSGLGRGVQERDRSRAGSGVERPKAALPSENVRTPRLGRTGPRPGRGEPERPKAASGIVPTPRSDRTGPGTERPKDTPVGRPERPKAGRFGLRITVYPHDIFHLKGWEQFKAPQVLCMRRSAKVFLILLL